MSPTRAWAIVRMDGFRISHPFLARDPKCPEERHPTRDCGCQVFRTLAAAEEYVAAQPIDLVPTEKAYELPADLSVVQVGDIVQVGKGKRRWTVKDFWQPERGGVLASLTIGGYVNQSVEVGRLTVVERPAP